MKEIKNLRKIREKHFLKENGEIKAYIYDEDIHFLKNNKYEEIDNTLIKTDYGYTNKLNDYHVYFNDDNYLMKIVKDNNYINIKIENSKNNKIIKEQENIYYKDILDNIDIKYYIKANKIKEDIILKDQINNNIIFIIETNLDLELINNKIKALKNNEIIFIMDSPFIYDNNNINSNIKYKLNYINNNYKLELILDKEYLDKANYPVIIDPTITEYNKENSVYDTYIYEGDTNVNRNNQDILKVGVEKENNQDRINRSLIKFDLPSIGTGSQVVDAKMVLNSYISGLKNTLEYTVNVYNVTEDWNEETANWNTMHNKYDSLVQGIFNCRRSYVSNGYITDSEYSVNITKLVKKWYTDTPNYGVMLKCNKEVYIDENYPIFYSKNNKIEGNPKPLLVVTYRNQNGLEDYMDYKIQNFTNGSSYINTYNGNLTTVFNIGSTISGKLPITLDLIYNTNDVILKNDIGYGLGYQLNFNQTIELEDNYLKYKDGDGTIHYFYNEDNKYKDEDGLSMTITKNNNEYILKDKNNNRMKFNIINKIGYLKEIIDVSDNKIEIFYENNKIIKIIDGNNKEINIEYQDNKINIVSPDKVVYLNYDNNKLTEVETITGTTYITYNSNNIIESIKDENGLKVGYTYYNEMPYRIKKIEEYGINNSIGNSLSFSYDNDITKIKNNKGIISNISFNNYGNRISVSNYNLENDIKNAYSMKTNYGENNSKNKLIYNDIPIRYVKNYLKNSSFENYYDFLESDCYCVNLSESNDSYLGNHCIKLASVKEEELGIDFHDGYYGESISVEKNKYYTFSAYIKNDHNISLGMHYINENNEKIEVRSRIIPRTDEYKRQDISIFYPNEASSELKIRVYFEEEGSFYIDCVQLEEGGVANSYNLIENSDFSNGLDGWYLSDDDGNTSNFEKVVIDNSSALKLIMEPNKYVYMSNTIKLNGKKQEKYNLSFWYKNEGVASTTDETSIDVDLLFMDDQEMYPLKPTYPTLNQNSDNWQCFSYSFESDRDFTALSMSIMVKNNINNLYVTNISLVKDTRELEYSYDINGNLETAKDLDNEKNEFNYDKNNELIKMTNPKGKNFTFEYDSKVTNRLINSISASGISNEIRYDENNNPIYTTITNYGKNEKITDGIYKIRLKGTNKYLKNKFNGLILKESDCNKDLWVLEQEEENYKIKNVLLNKYIKNLDNHLLLSNDYTYFNLIKNKDNSFLIKEKESDNYVKNISDILELSELLENDNNFEFYFENNNSLFIENGCEYTTDGRFIKSTTDTLFNKTIYDIDEITGLTKSITNPKGQVTKYEYDNKRRLSKVINKDKVINYTYNDNNNLDEIKEKDRTYKFIYDEFLNTKQIKINNNILVTNNYEENNGNLINSIYGNSHEIDYTYDSFDRISKIIKMDDTYNYKYDNNGNIAKILSNNDIYKYNYDLAKRINEYTFNDFKINYKYDKNSNISYRKYELNNIKEEINNTFNDDDSIIKSNNINYNYDYLGRLINKNINNSYNTNYSYVTNGKRTSTILKSIDNNNDIYSYRYDKLNNITHIYHNNDLINRYYYDDYNELIKEDNYNLNQTITYTYDEYGNILNKKVYELKTDNLLDKKIYEYSNNNWKDQLTKYNNEEITYDNIGNPITIGNKTLNWINGRQLKSINDDLNNIEYKYNKDGIRINKKINDKEIKYYVENSKVILEIDDNNVIYYMYNEVDDLIGFKYNNEIYYYIKNGQNDIIGILDSNYNKIVEYSYDSWGNIIEIKDNSTNNIGTINPFRYRSYYYDNETKLYYLNSRYYNPLWGRFINIDRILGANEDILSYNLYAYCSNNIVNHVDYNGEVDDSIAIGMGSFGFAASTVPGLGWIGLGIITIGGIVYASKVIDDTLSRVRSITKDQSRPAPEKPKKEYHDHHVVAKNSPKAAPARAVLNNVGIGINDVENLVSLPAKFHRQLHTNRYYFDVNVRVIMSKNKFGDSKENVIKTLEQIKNELVFKSIIFSQ